jgi:hypothetical protein
MTFQVIEKQNVRSMTSLGLVRATRRSADDSIINVTDRSGSQRVILGGIEHGPEMRDFMFDSAGP